MFGDGIDERIDGAVSYTFSKITAFGRATVWPVFKAIEHYAIGKGQEYFANPDEFRKKLFFDARCNLDGVAIESLGKLGGNISVVVPQSQAQVTSMLNRLDEETKARNPYAAFKFFSGSSSMIISEVSDDAIHHRKQLARFLVPSRYVQPVMAEVKKILGSQAEFIIREAVFDIVRTVLIQGILGIDKLPATTYQAMKNYSSDVNLWTAFPMPGLFRFVPSLRKKRAAYGLFAQEILEGQFETIVAELGRGTQPESRNLILMTIVDLIRKDHVKSA